MDRALAPRSAELSVKARPTLRTCAQWRAEDSGNDPGAMRGGNAGACPDVMASWLSDIRTRHYSGAALSLCSRDRFETSEAATMTTAINPMIRVQMALISGFTPSRTSE